jgi:hypothetical protein
MASILTDDICRDYAYLSKNSEDIMKMMNRFMQDTYVIPPSEWDPSIRIEPPPKYMSKVKIKIWKENFQEYFIGRKTSSCTGRKRWRN